MPAYVASDKFLFKRSILFTYLARINSFLICHTDETGEVIGLPFNRRIARENHAALDPVDTVAATIVRLATIHHIHVETTPIYLIYIYNYNDQEEELYQITAILSELLWSVYTLWHLIITAIVFCQLMKRELPIIYTHYLVHAHLQVAYIQYDSIII